MSDNTPKDFEGVFCLKKEHKNCKHGLNPVSVVVLSFLAVIVIGTFLLMLPFASKGEPTSFLDALFTSTSATCVTGLVVKDTLTHFSLFGQLVILLLIQIGGLGYMTVTTFFAMIIGRKLDFSHRLSLKESLNFFTPGGIFRFAKRIFFFIIVIEGIGALILYIRWRMLGFGIIKAFKYSVFHAVSAFNNAGFDLMGGFKSFTNYSGDWVILLTISILIILGGLGFIVLSQLYDMSFFKRGLQLKVRLKEIDFTLGIKRLNLQSKIVIYTSVLLIIAGTLLLFVFEANNPSTLGGFSLKDKLLNSYFQSVTARTAGFNTIDIGSMNENSLLTLLFLMFIGGSPGGTGGGIKTVTFIIVLASIIAFVKGKKETDIGDRKVSDEVIMKALSIFVLALTLVASFTFLLCAFNNFGFLKNLFEVVSAFGTVGLTLGITPLLNPISKIIIAITIFIGRVGILSFILSIYTAKYINKVKLPEEELSVG